MMSMYCMLQALIALKLDTVINGHMDVYHSCVCAFSFMCVPCAGSNGTFFLNLTYFPLVHFD